MTTIDFSVRRRDLAWAVALVVLLSAIWVARSDRADAGGGPPGTGIAVVYIAVGTNYPDALGVGPGAGLDGAPIIIVPSTTPIPAATATELVRLDPRTVVIIGGLAAISQVMEDALKALLPNATFPARIAGADRYATNALFSAATFPIEGWASIPAVAFTASSYAQDVEIFPISAGSASTGTLYAPIQLPHGAEILELQALAYDNHADDLTVRLYVATTVAAVIATVSSSGTPLDVLLATTTIAPDYAIVDNQNFIYYVHVTGATGNPSPFIRGVMVRYRLGTSNG
jgi:hypothetical protein